MCELVSGILHRWLLRRYQLGCLGLIELVQVLLYGVRKALKRHTDVVSFVSQSPLVSRTECVNIIPSLLTRKRHFIRCEAENFAIFFVELPFTFD